MHTKKSVTGFTLIEFMVVCAIVATIAAVSIPRFVHHRLSLKRNECQQNLQSLYKAELAYHQKNGTYTNDLVALGWTPQGSPRYLYGFREAPEMVPATTAHPSVIANCPEPPCYSTKLMMKGKDEAGPLYGPLTPYDLPADTFAQSGEFKVGCVG